MLAATKQLLSNTALIIKHKKEIEKIKGETFNVFSILKMDRRETVAHSPFIVELLNPNGSHQLGNVFLRLFLEIDKIKLVDKISLLNFEKIQVYENKHIGPVITEEGKESGGLLDICLFDNNNRSITIENKIDHNKEQSKQIVRYCKYNYLNNVVFYLTLFGTEPSEYSKGKLVCSKDFYLLSYKTDIIDWLKKCIKETGENAILRQSIRQYIILLQKLTFSMENDQEKQLDCLIMDYFDESAYIHANFIKTKRKIAEELRQGVIKQLIEKLGKEFNIYPGSDTNNRFSQIWIKYKDFDNAKLFYGIESFSPDYEEEMYVGILSMNAEPTEYCKEKYSNELYWPLYLSLEFENDALIINKKILQQTTSDKNFKAKFISHIASEIVKFIEPHKTPLHEFLKSAITTKD